MFTTINHKSKKPIVVRCPICNREILGRNINDDMPFHIDLCSHFRLWHKEDANRSPIVHKSMRTYVKRHSFSSSDDIAIYREDFQDLSLKGYVVTEYAIDNPELTFEYFVFQK